MASIAGKVAPRFMGAYNSSTTYQFYDAVTHNNKLYFCKKNGTVGKAPGNATDDNWFLSLDGTFADAASLGGKPASKYATTADLANYLPLDGSKAMNGNLYVGTSSGTNSIMNILRNVKRQVYQVIDTDGVYNLYDSTNSNMIIRSSADGGNNFYGTLNGTATGNLPLTGGTLNGALALKTYDNGVSQIHKSHSDAADYGTCITDKTKDGTVALLIIQANMGKAYFRGNDGANKELLHSGNYTDYALPKVGGAVGEGALSDSPLEIYGQFGTTKRSLIKHSYTGTLLGYIGFDYDGNPVIIHKSAGQKNLHHDGNSAKVAIQSTAPSDTTALWVDTANKKTKAYIDGAWTVIA